MSRQFLFGCALFAAVLFAMVGTGCSSSSPGDEETGSGSQSDTTRTDTESDTVNTPENTAVACSDHKDNDGDNDIDCDDDDCQSFAFCKQDTDTLKDENTVTRCSDDLDNDGDGDVDCEDADCEPFAICQGTNTDTTVAENTVTRCSDDLDNDGDGDVDCEDADCESFAICKDTDTTSTEAENNSVVCSDVIDNDDDGDVDCADAECKGFAFCQENTLGACQDNADNDADGLTDCADDDCGVFDYCTAHEQECSDSVDNDSDSLTDCADAEDCADEVVCGGACYNLTFSAPSQWGATITEANDDEDPNAECVQYTVVVTPSSPTSDTVVCLYVDPMVNGTPVDCQEPSGSSQLFFPVDLCQGTHILQTRVEPISEAPFFTCDPVSIQTIVWQNPSCTISAPTLSTNMGSPTFVNTSALDFTVSSNGSWAELYVAGALKGDQNFDAGTTTFEGISLGADSDQILVRARCYNPGMNNGYTNSPSYYVSKDTVAPNLVITEPLDGTSFSADECPFTVTVKGVEAGQEVCASYDGQAPGVDGCATGTTGPNEAIDLIVECVDGTNLDVIASTEDDHGNTAIDSIQVSADTGVPAVLIQSPINGKLYNKADDTLNAGTTAFEHVIIACTDGDYAPANVTLKIDDVTQALTPTVEAASCNGLTYRITFPQVAFSQTGNGSPTQHVVSITVSDGFNSSVPAISTFYNDTIAPVVSLSCPSCEPLKSFYSLSDDSCPSTPVFERTTVVQVQGLEMGRNVTLTVTNGGSGVGASPYTVQATMAYTQHNLSVAAPCGIELQLGQNQLRLDATDAAGNSATPAIKTVTYGSVYVDSPESSEILDAADDCDAGADFGIPVTVVADMSTPDGTQVTVTVSSDDGGWSYSSTTWTTACSGLPEGSQCSHNFCVSAAAGTVEQSDIQVELMVAGAPVPGGPTDIVVDLSAPPVPTNLGRTIVNRRAAQINLTWNASVDPQSGQLKEWDVRCVRNDTITEENWATAMQFSGEPTPGTSGQAQNLLISSDTNGNKVRTGSSYSCGIKGRSATGQWSSLATFPVVATTDIGLLAYGATIDGYTSGDFSNWYLPSIAPAGDVNNDDYDDVIVASRGKVAVYLGSATGLATSVAITCGSEASFGVAAAGIGDFNNDGSYSDIAVGAHESGKVYVFFGRANFGQGGLTCGGADLVITGPAGGDFGAAIAAAGDFDGDGRDDLAIGAPYLQPAGSTGPDGATFVVFGRQTNPGTINLGTNSNIQGDLIIESDLDYWSQAGTTIAAWDFDKDNRTDLAISAPWAGENYMGQVHVLLARKVTVNRSATTVQTVPFASVDAIDCPDQSGFLPEFGVAALSPVDTDKDGWVDLAVGARRANSTADGAEGFIWVFPNTESGGQRMISATVSKFIFGTATNHQLGMTVANAYDLVSAGVAAAPYKFNGIVGVSSDPVIVAGAMQRNMISSADTGPGYGGVWYGSFTSGATAADVTLAAPGGAVDHHWASVIGDINGDGYADLAVGDTAVVTASGTGRIVIYY